MREPAAIHELADLGQTSARVAQEHFCENAKGRWNLDRRKLFYFILVALQQLQLRAAEIAVPEVPLDAETICD